MPEIGHAATDSRTGDVAPAGPDRDTGATDATTAGGLDGVEVADGPAGPTTGTDTTTDGRGAGGTDRGGSSADRGTDDDPDSDGDVGERPDVGSADTRPVVTTPSRFTGHRDGAGDPSADAVVWEGELSDGRLVSSGADRTAQVWQPDRDGAGPVSYTGHSGPRAGGRRAR